MNNTSIVVGGVRFTTGDYVTFDWIRRRIEDARIYIVPREDRLYDVYLCQNEFDGNVAPDLFEYTYSYVIVVDPDLGFPGWEHACNIKPACMKPRDKYE